MEILPKLWAFLTSTEQWTTYKNLESSSMLSRVENAIMALKRQYGLQAS